MRTPIGPVRLYPKGGCEEVAEAFLWCQRVYLNGGLNHEDHIETVRPDIPLHAGHATVGNAHRCCETTPGIAARSYAACARPHAFGACWSLNHTSSRHCETGSFIPCFNANSCNPDSSLHGRVGATRNTIEYWRLATAGGMLAEPNDCAARCMC